MAPTRVLSGSLSDELYQLLPQELRDAYDLDTLYAADFFGRIEWTIRRASDWALGPTVGALFADAVLSQWSPIQPPEYWA